MEATFSAERLKSLHSALHCLMRLGDVLHLAVTKPRKIAADANGNGPDAPKKAPSVRLSAINTSCSAYCAFDFGDDFFDSIRFRSRTGQKLECQVSSRALMASLKTSNSQHKLERCEMIVDEGQECRIVIRMHHQQGVTKTHKLTYESQPEQFPSASPDAASAIVVEHLAASEWLQHFAVTGRGADISLWCFPNSCSIRSRSDVFESGKMRKCIQTEVTVELSQFELYSVKEEVFLTFPLKEFRAAVALAEAMMAPLQLNFSATGEPLFLSVYGETLRGEMTIATTADGPPERAEPRQAQAQAASSAEGNRDGRPVAEPRDERQRAPSHTERPQDETRRRLPSPQKNNAESAKPSAQNEGSQLDEADGQRAYHGVPRESTQRPAEAVRESVERPTEPPALPSPPGSQSNGLFLGGAMSQESQAGANEASSQRAPLSQLQSMILSHPPEPAKEVPQAPPPLASTPLVVNRLSDAHRKRPREVESLTMFADEGMDTAEDSFDYADAMDEMERGIRDGSIPVHGSQQPAESRRSSDRGQGRHGSAHGETQASLAAVEEGGEEDDQLHEEEAPLPPTQSTGSIPKRDRGDAGKDNVQKESTQQQQKKFKPMF